MARRGAPIVAALAAAALATPASAPAAVINVNVVGSPSDESPPVVDGDCTLREAVDAARLNTFADDCAAGDAVALDRITIPGGLVGLSGAAGGDDNAAGDLDLNGGGPLEIVGAGPVDTFIQGTGSDRVFDVLSGTVAISDVEVFDGAPTGEGGAVRVAGGATLNLLRGNLHNNLAAGTGGRGGAVYGPVTSTIAIDQSTVSDNTAQFANGSAAGGGIYSEGSLTIDETTVGGNHATGNNSLSYGGGVAMLGTSGSITNSTISNNDTSLASGGGLVVGRGFQTVTYEISGTTIENNSAPCSGGGIQLFGPNSLIIDDSNIRDNHVTGSGAGGGGISAMQNNPTDTLTITRSSIVDNDITGTESSAGFMGGAAIRTSQGVLTIRESLIAGNEITTSSPGIIGGAIRTLAGVIRIENSTLFHNTILAGAENAAGGAIGIYSPGSPTHGSARLIHTTVGGQIVTGSGLSVFAEDAGSVEMHGSLVGDDCVTGTASSPISGASSYNLLTGPSCNQGTDNNQVLPQDLGTGSGYTANGGPTDTVAVASFSPAVDMVPTAACDDLDGAPLVADQRAAPRPYGQGCDAGAYEYSECRGVPVDTVGTRAGEKLAGDDGPDGILALGGKDVVKGLDAEDGLCGGPGKDVLKGGSGDDALDGGPGKDTCKGGPGTDKAKSCEVRRQIP